MSRLKRDSSVAGVMPGAHSSRKNEDATLALQGQEHNWEEALEHHENNYFLPQEFDRSSWFGNNVTEEPRDAFDRWCAPVLKTFGFNVNLN